MPKKKKEVQKDSQKPRLMLVEEPSELKKHLSHLGEMEEKMLENMNNLQKINLHIAEKFDKLTNQFSSLLALFEGAAHSFATNPLHQVTEKDKEFLDKVDQLLEQNKLIAKGLTLMDENLREKVHKEPRRIFQRAIPLGSELRKPAIKEQEGEEKEPFRPSAGTKPLPKF
jgi:hypothetical protein